jgi:hypothetical protein
MTDLQCKVEASIRATHGVGLSRDGWVEDDAGMWYHPREDGPLTVGEAYLRQRSYYILASRQASFWVLGLLTSFYGILILIAKWNYICELLNI